jgi:nitrite reductase/ring-hydroxylating ferredoxin subunit
VPGMVRRVMEGRIVRCPWHQWEFDITTGQNLASPHKRVRTYDVEVVDGRMTA